MAERSKACDSSESLPIVGFSSGYPGVGSNPTLVIRFASDYVTISPPISDLFLPLLLPLLGKLRIFPSVAFGLANYCCDLYLVELCESRSIPSHTAEKSAGIVLAPLPGTLNEIQSLHHFQVPSDLNNIVIIILTLLSHHSRMPPGSPNSLSTGFKAYFSVRDERLHEIEISFLSLVAT